MSLQQQIDEYRREAAKRRAAAFCDAPEAVLGTPVLPLTPRTYSMLHAIGSPFVLGGEKREGDVRNYLWFHSRFYGHYRSPFWRWRKWWALNRLTTLLTQPIHRLFGVASVDRYVAVLVMASNDIDQIIHEALADCPASEGRGRPCGATMEAQLCDLFKRRYGWDMEYTRNQPLKRLFQLYRAMEPDAEDAGERAIHREYLLKRNQELRAAAQAEKPNGE